MFALGLFVLAVVGLLIRALLDLSEARKRNTLQGVQWARDLERWMRQHNDDKQLLESSRAERDNAWARLELIAAVMIRRPPRRSWLAQARKIARVSCGYLRLGPLNDRQRAESVKHFSRVSDDPFFYIREPAIGAVFPAFRTREEEGRVRRSARGAVRSLHMTDVLNCHARDA